jgi:hypothetical protein
MHDVRGGLSRYPKTVLAALMCWLCDLHLCTTMRSLPVNPQGHALWHLLMALSVYWVRLCSIEFRFCCCSTSIACVSVCRACSSCILSELHNLAGILGWRREFAGCHKWLCRSHPLHKQLNNRLLAQPAVPALSQGHSKCDDRAPS